MADLLPGRWYHLIGGERVRVEDDDAEAGITTVRDAGGQVQRMARSAFVGASLEPDVDDKASSTAGLDATNDRVPETEAGLDLDPVRAELEALDEELAETSTDTNATDQMSETKHVGQARESETESLSYEKTPATEGRPSDANPPVRPSEAAMTAADAIATEMLDPDGASGAADAEQTGVSADASQAPDRWKSADRDAPPEEVAAESRMPVDEPPGQPKPREPETGATEELDFGHPDDAASPTSGLGLSPLALGMLLGMLMLAGVAGWMVLESRLDHLEAQFVQFDERLQVVMGDSRRQGEALRTYLADPRAPRPAAVKPEAPVWQEAAARVDQLEAQLATEVERVAALERRLANQDAALAELDRRAGLLEKRPLSVAATPKSGSSANESTPVDPPVGYVVVLASLPVREQALQELDALRDKGLSVVLREARIRNATWYRVQAEGFRDRETASAFARTAESRHGVTGAWVVAP